MLLALSLTVSLAISLGATNLDMLTMHEIGEGYPQEAEVIGRLGKPTERVTFVAHKGHKYLRDQPLTCGSPSNDREVDALYYSVSGDSRGYWMVFYNEKMVCFGGYMPHDAIQERDFSEP